MTSNHATYLRQLHQLLSHYFNLAELQDLCFDLGVDYESLAGAEKLSRIRNLLQVLGRNGRLPTLISLAQQERSHIAWPPVPDDFQMPSLLAWGETAVWDGRIPYLGLTSFHESDAQFFFGREAVVADLLQQVQQGNFIVIAGPSGSGKSSVARAGLFHALRSGQVEKSESWLLATMQPKNDPMQQLAMAMQRATKSSQPGDAIREESLLNPSVLHQQIEMHLTDDSRQRCILLIDQFEELFTQTKDETIRRAFINLLTTAAQADESRAIIVLSLRSDFISACAPYETLNSLLSSQFRQIGPMSPPELAQAITQPALEVGAEIDPDLVSQIITDMKGEPGALPLMSFALRDLFEAEKTAVGEPMDLMLPEYLNLGGLESALARHANKEFDNFTDEQQALARGIFSKLIEVGQGRVDTRRTVAFQDLIPVGTAPESVTKIIAALAEEGIRLLTTDAVLSDAEQGTHYATVTIAHEKLIDAWPWLRQLVDENREMIALQNQINDDARAWSTATDPGFLYRGGRLLQVQEKLPLLQSHLDTLSQQFIQASLSHEHQRRRRQRVLQVGGAVVFAILVMLGIGTAVISGERNDAVTARETAVSAQSTAVANAERAVVAEETAVFAQTQSEQQRTIMSLIAQSQALLNVNGPDNQSIAQARLMAVAAAQIDQETTQGQNSPLIIPWLVSMARNVPASYQSIATLTDHKNVVFQTAYSPDDAFLASAACGDGSNYECAQGEIIIWDTIMWTPITVLTDHTDLVTNLTWNADSSRLASGANDGTIIIWDATTWQPLATLTDHTSSIASLDWSAENGLLASASFDSIIIWDVAAQRPLATLTDHTMWISSVAWRKDGVTLASAACHMEDDEQGNCSQSEIIIWDAATWQPQTTLFNHTDSITGMAWNTDGSRLATASYDDTAIIWDTATWQPLTTLTAHNDFITSIAWAAEGSRFATASYDNTVIIWDTATWQPITTLAAHDDWVNSVSWRADGTSLASASFDTTVIIWDTASWQPIDILTDHTDWVRTVDWHPNDSYLASGADDGTMIIWQVEQKQPDSLRLIANLPAHQFEVESVAWSSDGMRLASSSCGLGPSFECTDGEIVIWDTTTWTPITKLTDQTGLIKSVAWNADDTYLASGSSHGTLFIWDTTTWQPVATLSVPTLGITSVAWHPDGQHLAAATRDTGIIIWQADVTEANSWEVLTTLANHTSAVTDVAWHETGRFLASASFDKTVIIWDTVSWQPVATLSNHTDVVNGVDWGGGNGRFASASSDGTVIIWDTTIWEPLTILTDHTDEVLSVAWHEDGSHIASASRDETVIITDMDSVVARNCELAGRNFSQDEWQRLFFEQPYTTVCPQWPVHPSVPAASTSAP